MAQERQLQERRQKEQEAEANKPHRKLLRVVMIPFWILFMLLKILIHVLILAICGAFIYVILHPLEDQGVVQAQ
jgi:Na+/H+ antiporter NhaD/arsenite permease-like protein